MTNQLFGLHPLKRLSEQTCITANTLVSFERCPREGQIRGFIFTQNILRQICRPSQINPNLFSCSVLYFASILLFFQILRAAKQRSMNSRMVVLFLFPAWYFPNAIAFRVIYLSTTFPIVPVAAFISRDPSHMRTYQRVLADVSKKSPINDKTTQSDSGIPFKIKQNFGLGSANFQYCFFTYRLFFIVSFLCFVVYIVLLWMIYNFSIIIAISVLFYIAKHLHCKHFTLLCEYLYNKTQNIMFTT